MKIRVKRLKILALATLVALAAGVTTAAGGDSRGGRDKVLVIGHRGAGDAFGAVLLIALAAGSPLGRALDLACTAGARAASST